MPIHGLENYARETKPKHFDIETVIRPNILTLQPYRCARDDYQSGILLDANENALGHSIDFSNDQSNPNLYADMELHRYPDPAHTAIKKRIADLRQIPGSDHVFLGVGSDEVIDLLIRVCCTPGVGKIITTPPTYGMYAVCAQVNDVSVVKVPLNTERGTFQLNMKEVCFADIITHKNISELSRSRSLWLQIHRLNSYFYVHLEIPLERSYLSPTFARSLMIQISKELSSWMRHI